VTAAVVGQRIRLLEMPLDVDALPAGATGTIRRVLNEGTDLEQIDVQWDEPHAHRSLMMLPEVDRWEVIR
jgi:hypothetical protein